MSDGPFGGRAALWLGLAAALSLAVSGALAVFGDEFGPPTSAGADGFSRSALGHAAFLELLRARGVAVTTSRHHTEERAGEAVVLFLEPEVGAAEDDQARAVLAQARERAWRLLVVLPKRRALAPEQTHPGWLAAVALRPISDAAEVLEALHVEGEVLRPVLSSAWSGELPAPSLDEPQLVRSKELQPLVGTAEGMLAGEWTSEEGEHLVVLADPDVIETHGLGRGRNADLAAALVERLGAAERTALVDETLHGFVLQPSIARELFRPPLLLATVQALLALLLLAWTALVAFGKPHPPAPVLGSGNAVLVEHTAGLLGAAGHLGHAAVAYWRATREEIVRRLRTGTAPQAADAWLDHLAAARGQSRALRDLDTRVAALEGRGAGAEEDVVRIAQEIHRFREDLTHGSDRHTRR